MQTALPRCQQTALPRRQQTAPLVSRHSQRAPARRAVRRTAGRPLVTQATSPWRRPSSPMARPPRCQRAARARAAAQLRTAAHRRAYRRKPSRRCWATCAQRPTGARSWTRAAGRCTTGTFRRTRWCGRCRRVSTRTICSRARIQRRSAAARPMLQLVPRPQPRLPHPTARVVQARPLTSTTAATVTAAATGAQPRTLLPPLAAQPLLRQLAPLPAPRLAATAAHLLHPPPQPPMSTGS
mmetsp:Transcript_14521/g.42417  ORF Transcript_14521/g.42417 Transcript_14521/m.42417 type:complete len:239 (+) Transcript_14521:923-1639(+)